MLLDPFNYRLGITINSDKSIRLAVIKKTFKGWTVKAIEEGFLQDLTEAMEKYAFVATTASLPFRDVIIKYSESGLKKNSHIEADTRFQIEQLLPFPQNSGVFRVFFSRQKDGNKTDVFTFITRKEKIQLLLHNLSSLPFTIDRVSCGQLDLKTLLRSDSATKDLSGLVVYFGQEDVKCLLMKNSHPLFSYSFKFSSSEQLLTELVATIDHLGKQYPEKMNKKIYFINPPELLLINWSSSHCPESEELLPTIFTNLSKEERLKYGDTIVAALSGSDPKGCDFQQDDQSLSKCGWKKYLKKWYFPLTYISLICTIITGTTGWILVNRAKRQVKANIAYVLGDDSPQKHKKIGSLKQCCSLLEGKLKNLHTSYYYPLLPETLSFSKILNELTSSHVFKEGKIVITAYDYELISFPSLTAPSSDYVAKITLSGKSIDKHKLSSLKSFFTSLNEPKYKNQFTWEEKSDGFTTSFYLCELTQKVKYEK
ncbi:MAG: hypothetical protein RSB82_00555 [Victivallaceae bacterium]